MTRAGFGGADDYSGLFASLWREDQNNREQLARELESRNKERQAAKDSEVFSKFQNGEMSGADLLSYIRRRIDDTAYDPQEQAKWKDALRDYQDSIATQNAEDAYANGGSIHDLIAFYQQKKKDAASGSPEYSEASKRLNDLIDQAASDDIYMGAERIQQKIARGQASLDDLRDFYKRQLRSLRPGSSLRQSVQQSLDQVSEQVIQQDNQRRIAEIDFKFNAGQLTADQANQQITQVANQFRESDPVRYYQLLQQGQGYLRSAGETAIPNPDALSGFGAPGGLPSGGTRSSGGGKMPTYGPSSAAGPTIRFVTQLDGSPYAHKNCVFASGAMLAQAMGVGDLSGGDLRWLSGDTAGGSDWHHLRRALKQVGLDSERDTLTFAAFTQRVAGGQPAVIGGNTARLPDNLRGDYIGGHAIYIDRYDPKRGFLVYNPAKRHSQGQWWSPEVLREFAWGDKQYDSAVFAPKSAVVNPGTRKAPAVNISAWDPPKRASTPKNYGVGNDPGVDGRTQDALDRAGIKPTPRTDLDGNPRPYNLGLPTTKDEVADQLDVLSFQRDRAVQISEAFARGDQWYVEADGSKTPLTQQLVTAEANAALSSIDYSTALGYSINDPQTAQDNADARARLTKGLLGAGDDRQEFLFNQMLTDIRRSFAYSDTYDSDPAAARGVVQAAIDRLSQFDASLDPNQPDQPEAVNSEFKSQVHTIVESLKVAADPDADPAARNSALAALPSSVQDIGQQASGVVTVNKGIEEGSLVRALVQDAKSGAMTWGAVPARQETLADGTTRIVPDTVAPFAPMVVDGKVVYAQITDVPTGVRQIALTGDGAQLSAILAANGGSRQTVEAVSKMRAGQVIPTAYLAGLSPNVIAQLSSQGVITTNAPLTARGIVIPASAKSPEQTWVQDPETLLWYKDRLPTSAKPDPLGLGTVEIDASGPQVVFRPNASGDGYYLPFSGDPKLAQQALNNGELAPYIPPFLVRDASGQAVDPSLGTGTAPDPRFMYDRAAAGSSQFLGNLMARAATQVPASSASAPAAAQQLPGAWGPPSSTSFFAPGAGPDMSFQKDLMSLQKAIGDLAKPVQTPNVNAQTGFVIPPSASIPATHYEDYALRNRPSLPVITLPRSAPPAQSSFTIPPSKSTVPATPRIGMTQAGGQFGNKLIPDGSY